MTRPLLVSGDQFPDTSSQHGQRADHDAARQDHAEQRDRFIVGVHGGIVAK